MLKQSPIESDLRERGLLLLLTLPPPTASAATDAGWGLSLSFLAKFYLEQLSRLIIYLVHTETGRAG